MSEMIQSEARLVAELNDLLQLDHDAVGAYDLAIRALRNDTFRETIRTFRADHQRHIQELTRLVTARGGVAIQLPHLPTGVFKLVVQQAGALGGDRAVLLTFKANERQGRDRYRRAAEHATDPDVSLVLSRAAADEARHYAWVLETLDDLGAGPETTAGRVEQVVEVAQARVGDAIESAERGAMFVAEGTRRALRDRERPLLLAAGAVAAGLIAATLFDRDRRGRGRSGDGVDSVPSRPS